MALTDLQKQRAALLKKIQDKGGKAKNPALAKQLSDLDGKIKTERGDAPKTEEGIKLTKDQETVKNDVQGGQELSNLLGLDKPLSTISTDTPEDQKKLIESIRQLQDPNSDAFVGKRSDEEKAGLSNLQGIFDQSKDQSPEEKKALDALSGVLDSAGLRSQDTTDLLSKLKGDTSTAGQRTGERSDALAALKGVLDKAGVRSDEATGALARLTKISDESGRTGETQGFLDTLKGAMGTEGKRTGDTADVIAKAKASAATAGQRSQEMQETLNLMKGGLAGLNAPENQALREQAQKEVDRKYRGALDEIASATRRGGLRGGAANASRRLASRDAMGAQGDLEQKNLLANIDIQDRRRNDFASTLGTTENAEFGRGNAALSTYGDAVGGAETREFAARDATRGAYGQALGGAETREAGRKQDAANSLAANLRGWEGQEFDQRLGAATGYNAGVSSAENDENARYNAAIRNYAGTLGDTEGREFDQRSGAAQGYASGVNNQTANRFNRMTQAADALSGRTNQLGDAERGRVRMAMGDYGAALNDRNTQFMDATKVNLGQERTDRAAQSTSAFGIAGLTANERARRDALKGTRRSGDGSGDGRVNGYTGRGPTSGTGSTTPVWDPAAHGGFKSPQDEEYYNSINGIYNNR